MISTPQVYRARDTNLDRDVAINAIGSPRPLLESPAARLWLSRRHGRRLFVRIPHHRQRSWPVYGNAFGEHEASDLVDGRLWPGRGSDNAVFR